MRKFTRNLFLVILAVISAGILCPEARANNVALTNLTLASQNTGTQTYQIKFDMSWNNSWFVTGAPSSTANWDAVWVFAKFRHYSSGAWSTWAHCTLNNSGNTVATGSHMAFGGYPYEENGSGAPDTAGITSYKGVFIYASGAETGSVSYTGNQLQWKYGTDGVGNTDKVEVRVFGIEMVYVPGYDSSLSESGFSFYVGDPGDTLYCPFYDGGNSANAYQVTGESAITVAESSGDLWYDGYCGDDQTGPIPATFPKGYNAYYIMKYDITQREYAEFLNTLNPVQQQYLWATGSFGNSYYGIKQASNGLFGVDCENAAGPDGSADYSLMNSSTGGGWRGDNYLDWSDVAAFAAWSGLRPATEFEIEKASRGPNAAVTGEYSWGTTVIAPTTGLTNTCQASEVPSTGNCNYSYTLGGPVRAGSYATSSSTRQVAGAGYYGAMELSGNLWKRDVTVGNSTGRGFTGTHGSGELDSYGFATNSDWPGYYNNGTFADVSLGYGAIGIGFIGGDLGDGATYSAIADRSNASNAYNAPGVYQDRGFDYGGRLVRTAP